MTAIIRKTTILALVSLLCVGIALSFGGCRKGLPPSSTAPSTTMPTETAETTPPTTTEYIEAPIVLNTDSMIALLEEAGECLDDNETLVLASHKYEFLFIREKKLAEAGIVSVSDETITILDCGNKEYRDNLRFLVYLNFMLERYPDCYIFHKSNVFEDSLYFYFEYVQSGFNTAQEFFDAGGPAKNGELWAVIYFSIGEVHLQGKADYVYLYTTYPEQSNKTYFSQYLQSKNEG